MITEIVFENYKCLPSNFPFELNKINIFTGFNGRGKSSLLQALLMLSQSVRNGDTKSLQYLHLNGEFVQLGDFYEIQADDKVDDVRFKLKMKRPDSHEIDFVYRLSDNDIKVAQMHECYVDKKSLFSSLGASDDVDKIDKSLGQLPLYINQELSPARIHFISASRQGPVKYVDKREIPATHKVGVNGDFTINTLSSYQEMIPVEMNADPEDKTPYDLRTAASLWLARIMDGGKVEVEDTSKGGANKNGDKRDVLSMDFAFEGKGNNRSFRAYNVGFGYSYIMSIIVTALIAKPGNIVIIENPEAHLHPLAQLELTYMLARLAARGVQVFIETHSDHILNGFRLAALKEEYAVTNEDFRIYFFDRDFEVKDLRMGKNAKIPNWPSRFFDQINIELAEIIKLGAGRV